MNFVLLFTSILLGVMGQILMKWGIVSPKPLFQQHSSVMQLLVSWPVLLGLGFYAISSVFWLATLRKMDLSYAYPMVSIGYVLVLLAGSLFFNEGIPPIRWWGMGLIIMGVICVSRS